MEPSQYSAFWEQPPRDFNLKALRDPIGTTDNTNHHKKWREAYNLARQVMRGEIADPTNGANHYYDDSINSPAWAQAAELRLKIETLNFYYLEQ